MSQRGPFTPEDIEFQDKVVHRSGLGDETCVTPAIASYTTGLDVARKEFETTCFQVVEELIAKTGVDPKRIRFLVTNSSLFNPTPSLGAMIMNRFKLASSVQNYSLGGMGCSAGVIALDLAKQLLEHNPGEYCLVVSHENITNAHYKGRDRSMLVSNCIFRANGAAMLLSSRAADAGRAKYKLRHVVRTNLAADDQAFGCVVQMDDDQKQVSWLGWLVGWSLGAAAEGRGGGCGALIQSCCLVKSPLQLTDRNHPTLLHPTAAVGRPPRQGADERRGARAALQHDHPGPPGPPPQRAARLRRQPGAPQDRRQQQAHRAAAARRVDEALHTRLQEGV
jgi:hypothetical protein